MVMPVCRLMSYLFSHHTLDHGTTSRNALWELGGCRAQMVLIGLLFELPFREKARTP